MAEYKQGLDYFPFRIDLLSDNKLRKLKLHYGYLSVMVYIALLSLLYKDKGYYIDYSDKQKENVLWDILLLLQGNHQPSPEIISEIIEGLVTSELFDNDLFQKKQILTCRHAQMVYYRSTIERKTIWIDFDKWLLTETEMKRISQKSVILKNFYEFQQEKSGQPISEQNQPIVEENRPRMEQNRPILEQRKEKNRKVNKRIEKQTPLPPCEGGDTALCSTGESLAVQTAADQNVTPRPSEALGQVIPLLAENNFPDGESLAVQTAVDQKSRSKTRTKRKSTLSSAQQAEFQRFWEVYPSHKSVGRAEKAWATVNPDGELTEAILIGVENAKKYDYRFREPRYIPYPASWLNAKGWLDEMTITGGNENVRIRENRCDSYASGSEETAQGKQALSGLGIVL